MAFTTWAALYTKMLDALESGSWRTAEWTIDDTTQKFTSFKDYFAALKRVEKEKEREAGTLVGRTYGQNCGRGW